MRRKDREVSDLVELEEIIRRCDVCRLGLAQNNVPYVVPLNFGYELVNGRLTLYFHCAKKGKKLDILKQNPLACFEMDCGHLLQTGAAACDCTMRYESVVGTGTVEELQNTEEKKLALTKIMEQYSGKGEYEYSEQMLAMVSVLKLTAAEFSGKRSRQEQ